MDKAFRVWPGAQDTQVSQGWYTGFLKGMSSSNTVISPGKSVGISLKCPLELIQDFMLVTKATTSKPNRPKKTTTNNKNKTNS